jgi:glycosyltransferase involved in cell wall biosynthesis
MFGLGPLEGKLRDMISEMRLEKYISLNGTIQAQEFSDYLNSVSFLIIPSRIESIPVVFSDSLQMGTPVVSMPVGDLGRIITGSGCGIVADGVSAEALARAIKEAAIKGRDFFKENTAKAYEQFEIKRAVDKWLDFNSPRHRQELK